MITALKKNNCIKLNFNEILMRILYLSKNIERKQFGFQNVFQYIYYSLTVHTQKIAFSLFPESSHLFWSVNVLTRLLILVIIIVWISIYNICIYIHLNKIRNKCMKRSLEVTNLVIYMRHTRAKTMMVTLLLEKR